MAQHPGNPQPKPRPRLPADVVTAAELQGITPLEYMLQVMRNPKTSARRRDRMAVTAARYLHPRPGDVGKKHQQDEAADNAGIDSQWCEDLAFRRQ